MLDERITDLIQIISLPLELIGFVLTLIEIYNSKLADAIENNLDAFSEIVKKFHNINLWHYDRYLFWFIFIKIIK